jgi:hypothetical protein
MQYAGRYDHEMKLSSRASDSSSRFGYRLLVLEIEM